MKKMVSVCLFCLFTLVACGGGVTTNYAASPGEKNVHDIVTNIYSRAELDEIQNAYQTISEYTIEFPIECIRKTDCGYRVAYCSDSNDVLLMWFDDAGQKLHSYILHATILKADLSNMEKDATLTHLKTIDPYGQYWFLESGRNDYTKISTHITCDGYIVTVYYSETLTVQEIIFELI